MKPESECFYADVGIIGTIAERPEISLISTFTNKQPDEQVVNCGYTPVVLSKLFGPMIFADLRIRADMVSCQWIVERRNIATHQFEEVIRIPGQKESDFVEDD